MEYKNWNEFWGEFLQVTFHLENPDRWPSRERKALWCQNNLGLKPGDKILDLGCGDGLIDIWLSRLGFDVTAVDQNDTTLKLAKNADDTKRVQFISCDLKEVQFPKQTFDAMLFLETSGLMSKEKDAELFKQANQWLKPGGKIILDCPSTAERTNSWVKDFPQGRVSGQSSFDAKTRLQNIQFTFKPLNGSEFGLFGTYDPLKNQGPGIVRYLYPKNEMQEMIEGAGFEVEGIEHYYQNGYYALIGVKRISLYNARED